MTHADSAPLPHNRRPWPWGLFFHFMRSYFWAWFFLAFVIFLVQTVLSFMLHDREDLRIFLQMLDRIPPMFQAMIGGESLSAANLEGVVAIGYQHPLVLICLMVFATATPTGLLTGEVERGGMELLLSRPVTRTRMYILVMMITMLGQALLICTILTATTIWTRVFDYGQPIMMRPFLLIAVNLGALAYAVIGLGHLVAAVMNERGRAVGLLIGYLVFTFLMDFGAVMWEPLEIIHPYTLFTYYKPNRVIEAGALPYPHLAVLFAVGTISLLAGYVAWRRRDIAAA